MISINDLSCNTLPANSAELRALERKMIDELYAKANYVPPKATPLDVKGVSIIPNLDVTVSRAFELALAGFNTAPARLKLPAPAYLLTGSANEVIRAYLLKYDFYLARFLNALSSKTALFLRWFNFQKDSLAQSI